MDLRRRVESWFGAILFPLRVYSDTVILIRFLLIIKIVTLGLIQSHFVMKPPEQDSVIQSRKKKNIYTWGNS